MEAPPARRSVCVTGAGGFIASWLVKLLLSRGDYVVNGTVRDQDCETVENRLRNLVDVCDVADALVLAYENSEAYGRYVCSSTPIKVSDMVNILKTLYPTNTYPKNSMEVEDILQKFFGAFGEDIISHSMEVEVEDIISYSKKLGWTFRPAEETVRDSIESYRAFGVQVWLLHLQPLADSCK